MTASATIAESTATGSVRDVSPVEESKIAVTPVALLVTMILFESLGSVEIWMGSVTVVYF